MEVQCQKLSLVFELKLKKEGEWASDFNKTNGGGFLALLFLVMFLDSLLIKRQVQ